MLYGFNFVVWLFGCMAQCFIFIADMLTEGLNYQPIIFFYSSDVKPNNTCGEYYMVTFTCMREIIFNVFKNDFHLSETNILNMSFEKCRSFSRKMLQALENSDNELR